MNNLSDFANFGELQIFWGSGGRRGRGCAQNGSLRPGRQKPLLRRPELGVEIVFKCRDFCAIKSSKG